MKTVFPSRYVSQAVESAVEKLVRSPQPFDSFQACEFYEAHDDYDVLVTVSLLPKHSQKDRGLQMFHDVELGAAREARGGGYDPAIDHYLEARERQHRRLMTRLLWQGPVGLALFAVAVFEYKTQALGKALTAWIGGH